MCRSSFPEISPFTCKLAPSRAVEPDGVVLSGRMASVLMAVPSIFAEADFATGAGISGALAVVGCGISGFLFSHILILCGERHLQAEISDFNCIPTQNHRPAVLRSSSSAAANSSRQTVIG